MRLVDVEPARPSSEYENVHTTSEASSRAASAEDHTTTGPASQQGSARAPVTLHTIAELLNAVLKFVGIHAKVL